MHRTIYSMLFVCSTLGKSGGYSKVSQISLSSILILVLAVGTVAFDLRVGLYDDPPNQEIINMIKATFDGFKYLGNLNRGWESQLYTLVTTPSYRKFCESQDTLFSIGQKVVDKKVADLKKLAEDGDEFVENQGKLSS